MPRIQSEKRGFTLIELLVVIAIIGILAGFLIGNISGVLTKAKNTAVQNSLNQIRTILVTYYTDHNSYPPAYGYLTKTAFNEILPEDRGSRDTLDPYERDQYGNPSPYFVTESYMNKLGIHGNLDFYDQWGIASSDTDYNLRISRFEYYPPTGKDFELVDIDDFEVLDEQRPFIYIPINLRQFRRIKKIWDANGGFPDYTNSKLQEFHFPPASYDAFALVSVGVVANTQGLIYDFGPDNRYGALDEDDYAENYYYHIAGLAIYYMLTRDMDGELGNDDLPMGDGVRDFDFNGRNTGDQTWTFPHMPTDQLGNIRPDADGNTLGGKIGPGIDGPIYIIQE